VVYLKLYLIRMVEILDIYIQLCLMINWFFNFKSYLTTQSLPVIKTIIVRDYKRC